MLVDALLIDRFLRSAPKHECLGAHVEGKQAGATCQNSPQNEVS